MIVDKSEVAAPLATTENDDDIITTNTTTATASMKGKIKPSSCRV